MFTFILVWTFQDIHPSFICLLRPSSTATGLCEEDVWLEDTWWRRAFQTSTVSTVFFLVIFVFFFFLQFGFLTKKWPFHAAYFPFGSFPTCKVVWGLRWIHLHALRGKMKHFHFGYNQLIIHRFTCQTTHGDYIDQSALNHFACRKVEDY